jgi:adenosylcobinamide-GDP ribazoletransferase
MRAAFSYFSILPVGFAAAPRATALAYLPLVGSLTGALAGTCAWGISLVAPHAVAVAVAFGASIVLTGAIHVDGFLDTADAVFASVTPARRLEIMHDPRHGTFAIAGFAVVCALWLAALWSIDPVRLPLALAFAAATARWAAVGVARVMPYAGSGANAPAFATRPPWTIHLVMAALVILLGWCYWGHAVLLIGTGALTYLAAFAIAPRLGGGLTGDVYGFLIVCTEVAVLAALPEVS